MTGAVPPKTPRTPNVASKTIAKRKTVTPRGPKKPAGEQSFVYVLGSFHKGRYISYVGWTNDVARRLDQHNTGVGARSTRGRVWILLHTESFATRNEAMSREWYLKRDRIFRKQLMDGIRARASSEVARIK
ncbi:GIY-YIG nuclease family protein [Bradyrhizobium sp. SYSU BS000235]|uniref:GIY-YIG nuclease family protein n=1 Tax=Bradyrhizobium sp. SYSU BS000235 TaxID=3411332 RepID=UPI003C7844B6